MALFVCVSCSDQPESTNSNVLKSDAAGATTVKKEKYPTAEVIVGNWKQIGQRCDAAGGNCQEMKSEVTWKFDGSNVSKNGTSQAYEVDGSLILIGDKKSPYKIAVKKDGYIVLKAVTMNRYLKLEKM